MRDPVGRLLAKWRVQRVLPEVRGSLLDVGCGEKHLVNAYEGEGLGVDVHQWGEVDIVVSDTSKLPFEADRFDTVTIIAALNHIRNRLEVLVECCRVLKPGGRLILTMLPPRISAIWHRLRRRWDADQTERGMQAGEVYGLTKLQVAELLEKAGFRILSERRFMLGMNRITIAERP